MRTATSCALADAVRHALRSPAAAPEGARMTLCSHSTEASHRRDCAIVTRQFLSDWLRRMVGVAAADSTQGMVLGLALPPFSVAESACMIAVASEPLWAYVPLDCKTSSDRQLRILDEAGADGLVTWQHSALCEALRRSSTWELIRLPSLPSSSLPLCYLRRLRVGVRSTPKWLHSLQAGGELPLYVIFTSGSTGSPKGVVGTRRGALERVKWMHSSFQMHHSKDSVMRATRLTFVDSVAEILGATLSKVPLVHVRVQPELPLDSVVLHTTRQFLDTLGCHQVTRLTIVPSVFRALLTVCSGAHEHQERLQKLATLRVVFLSGEVLPLGVVEIAQRLMPDVTLVNLFGSTEVSGDVAWKQVPRRLSDAQVERWRKLGVPIADWPAEVIGETTELGLRDGDDTMEGELCVRGGAVAAGYLVSGELERPLTKWTSESWFRMGDQCRAQDGELFVVGRLDRLVKIRGNRVQLDDVERAVKKVLEESCVETAGLTQVVAVPQGIDVGADGFSCVVLCSRLTSLSSARPCTQCKVIDLEPTVKKNIQMQLQARYGSLFVPQDLAVVDSDGVERLLSGKIDSRSLRARYEEHKMHAANDATRGHTQWHREGEIEEKVLTLIKEVIGSNNSQLQNDSTWAEMGGNSLHAALISWEIEQKLKIRIHASEIIENTVTELMRLATSRATNNAGSVTEKPAVSRRKFIKDESLNDRSKRRKTEQRAYPIWYSRYNQPSHLSLHCIDTGKGASGLSVLLSVAARIDLGKCVDASPLIVRYSKELRAFIGSHSGQFVCVEVNRTGSVREIWRRLLDDRIEATAAFSASRALVLVGTYSGALYAIDSQTGAERWRFCARDMIKATPLVIESLDIVVAGSYDRCAYGLDTITGKLLWTLKVSGSIFSTPVFRETDQRLIVATTTGAVTAWRIKSREQPPTEQWTACLPAPVFSSLVSESTRVLVGCADSNLYALSSTDGAVVWRVQTHKPIFSTPSVYAQQNAVFGCHDGQLRKVSTADGRLHWQVSVGTEPGDAIFASPYVAAVEDGQQHKHLICIAATTSGRLPFLCAQSGRLLPTSVEGDSVDRRTVFGEIFSSPVVVDDLSFVGTRQNELLVFRIKLRG